MKFFIKTYGCAQNQADSLLMEQVLKKDGLSKSDSIAEADYLIVNTCTVKTPTENKIMRFIQDNSNKRIIITGCMAKTHEKKFKKYNLVGCDNVFEIARAIREDKSFLYESNEPKINEFPISKNEVIEIIPICKGCVGDCTYCATKFARGRLFSYNEIDILSHIKSAIKRGKKEFWLTAEDTGCYGLDKGTTIINLLKGIISFEGFFKIRLGMMNPKWALKYKKELIEILKSEKMFKFLHIPIQSASDKILKLMNRPYSKEDLIELFDYLKKHAPKLAMATDIIVGFPQESKKDFNETHDFIKKYTPKVLNISKYWNRPNTLSSKMDRQVGIMESKERAIKLMDLHKSNLKKMNENFKLSGFALCDENGFARTDDYTKIKSDKKLGEYYKINHSLKKNFTQ